MDFCVLVDIINKQFTKMEFALPELLSRDAILNILYQRRLHIPNLNEFTNEELMRVYKTFVVPLSRRPERLKRISFEKVLSNQSTKNTDKEEQMEVSLLETLCTSMDIDLPSGEISNNSLLKTHWRMTTPFSEKRKQISSDENDDQYLSSATKRIKINS